MYLTRAFLSGLVIAVVVVVAGTAIEMRDAERAPPIATIAAARYDPVTVVDVAHGVVAHERARGAAERRGGTIDPTALATLLRLRGHERIVAVGERGVATELAAGAALAEQSSAAGSFIDLTVASPAGSRRILVLLH